MPPGASTAIMYTATAGLSYGSTERRLDPPSSRAGSYLEVGASQEGASYGVFHTRVFGCATQDVMMGLAL
jgi:hypothetical protein